MDMEMVDVDVDPQERLNRLRGTEDISEATGGIETTNFGGGEQVQLIRPGISQAQYVSPDQLIPFSEFDKKQAVEGLKIKLNLEGYSSGDLNHEDFFYGKDKKNNVYFTFRKEGKLIDRDVNIVKKSGEFRSVDAILKDLGVGGRRELGIEPKGLRAELITEANKNAPNVVHIKSLVERSVQSTDEEKKQLIREVEGYKKELDTIHGQRRILIAKIEELKTELEHEEQKLKDIDGDYSGTSAMSKEDVNKKISDIKLKIDASQEALSELNKKYRSQIDGIKESIHRFLDKKSGTLRERIATLFREQGVTIFSIVSAIGLAIGVLVEALLPGGGAVSKPSGGARDWLKKKVEALKNLLKKLADKFGAALPGILGSAVSWVFNTLSKVAGFVAQNLWTLFLAAAYLIYDYYQRNK